MVSFKGRRNRKVLTVEGSKVYRNPRLIRGLNTRYYRNLFVYQGTRPDELEEEELKQEIELLINKYYTDFVPTSLIPFLTLSQLLYNFVEIYHRETESVNHDSGWRVSVHVTKHGEIYKTDPYKEGNPPRYTVNDCELISIDAFSEIRPFKEDVLHEIAHQLALKKDEYPFFSRFLKDYLNGKVDYEDVREKLETSFTVEAWKVLDSLEKKTELRYCTYLSKRLRNDYPRIVRWFLGFD